MASGSLLLLFVCVYMFSPNEICRHIEPRNGLLVRHIVLCVAPSMKHSFTRLKTHTHTQLISTLIANKTLMFINETLLKKKASKKTEKCWRRMEKPTLSERTEAELHKSLMWWSFRGCKNSFRCSNSLATINFLFIHCHTGGWTGNVFELPNEIKYWFSGEIVF